jgi:anti-sigma factor RsiW
MTEHGIPVNKREHRRVHELLSAYVDDELSSRDRSRVEQHLSLCADCRADLHSLRWTKRLLGQAPALKIPRSFVVREADLEKARPTRRRRSLWATQWATAVVALLFVLVMGSDLLLGGGAMRMAQSAPEAAWVSDEAGPTMAMTEVHEEVQAVVVESEAPVRPGDEGAGAGAVITPDAANKEIAPEVRGVQADAATEETPPPPAEKMMLKVESETSEAEVDLATPEAEVMLAAPEKEETTPVPPPLPAERDLEADTEGDGTPDDIPAETTYGEQETGLNLRLVWRIVEVVLGTALIGLLVAVLWLRRRG